MINSRVTSFSIYSFVGYQLNVLLIMLSMSKDTVNVVGSGGEQKVLVFNLLRSGNVTAFSSTSVGN